MTTFEHVMCIDDDRITLMLLSILFKKYGFANKISSFTEATKAVDYLQTCIEEKQPAPEVIFLDLNMAVMNGWEFLEVYNAKLGPSLPSTKIIVLTSSIDPIDHEKALLQPYVYQFLQKPLSNEHLDKIKP